MSEWDGLTWFVVLAGIADAWLCGFDADGWRLRHGDPAGGTLGILPPRPGDPPATVDDALWLADAIAFDHDAPVGVRPAVDGPWPAGTPIDPDGLPPVQPAEPLTGSLFMWYWEALADAYNSAALLRFNASYAIRYGDDDSDPGTDFARRFEGREERLAMYAMATRRSAERVPPSVPSARSGRRHKRSVLRP